jgi:putative sulfotransferase
LERFVVGTGRCGSTLLSRMLSECPQVLSIFEFFTGLDMLRRFASEAIDGHELGEIIAAEQPFVTAVLRRGYAVEEITYPFVDSGKHEAVPRHSRGDPLPWILVSVLPRFGSDPDALFDEVMAYVDAMPRQPPGAHYRQLFGWMTRRFRRSLWIERSGSSIDYVGDLRRVFPDARFVHIHRSGPEVALSMRQHHAYRLPISLLYDVPLDGGQRVSELPPLDFDSTPHASDTISRILSSRPPAEYFGRYWCDQIERGKGALEGIAPDRLLEVRFEELIAEPHRVLLAIASFFELDVTSMSDEGDWIDRAARLIRGTPRPRLGDLAPDERRRLREACEPARRLLDARA